MNAWLSGFGKYIFRNYLMNVPWLWFRIFIIRKIVLSIESNVFIGMGFNIKGLNGKITIGKNCVINQRVLLDCRGGGIAIGNNVDIGEETNIWTQEHDPNDPHHGVKGDNVTICDHVWIATRVTILPGVKIGRGAVVACNSVVTKDVPELTIVGGIPAKVIGIRKNDLSYDLNYRPYFY